MQLPKEEKSLWREAYSRSLYSHLDEELEVDAAIVGAGITGLSSAYLLKQAGFTVAVLDQDTVGGGTTGRTTGKVTSQHSLIYAELLGQLGPDATRLYGEANEAAIEQVERIIKQEKIDCDWQRADNYVYTADPKQVEKFKNEAKVAASLGLPASFETSLALPFEVQGAVKFANQAKFSSQKYLIGLAATIHGNGSYVFEHSKAVSIRDGNPCTIRTAKGKLIAKHIIVATNVPTMPLMARGGYCILEYPTESYIVAAPYSKDMPGMYISPDRQHYSILPVQFNNNPYLLIGGGGHLSGMRVSKEAKFKQIANYAEKHFGITTITHKWSDRDYIAYDKVPLIGKLYPWSKNLYVATAFKKWGLSNGTVAALILTDLVAGNKNTWAPVFTPQRLRPIKSIPKAVLEQTKHLISQ